MKYVKGLIEKKLNKWKGKEWYHQRFDGSPYFMSFIGESEIGVHVKRKLGGDFTVHYCFYDNGKADWYIEMGDIKKVYTSIMKAAGKKSDLSSRFLKLWKKDEDLFYSMCLKVGKTDIEELSDKKLINLHDDFLRIALNRFSSSSLIDGFALGTDQLIADKIKDVYEKSKLRDKMRFTEVFSALTAPTHLSFINESEFELMKIALAIKKSKKNEKKLLEEYQKKFFWIRNNYVDSFVLDVNYFKKEVNELLASKIDLAKEIKRIKNLPTINKKNKNKLLKSLEISSELKNLLKISEDFTFWQDERKRSTFWAIHYCSLILEEICQRTGISLDNIKYLSPREVSVIFQKKFSLKELQVRKNNCVFYWDKEGFEIVNGKQADKVKQKILGSMEMKEVDDFRGLSASTGKAAGTVKILKSAKEIAKIEKGDILVAVMTRPDYIQAIKKAAAIITDEGGITCHAAIISRELGIPCIIGTKIATKVLHDGDRVEVNANHGIVKILKK